MLLSVGRGQQQSESMRSHSADHSIRAAAFWNIPQKDAGS